jgi:hypothetical protein
VPAEVERLRFLQMLEILRRGCPGADPTKHDFPNFIYICKIFSQICIFLQICEKSILPNFEKNSDAWIAFLSFPSLIRTG